MVLPSPTLDQVLTAAEQLPPDDRLRLIRQVAETLLSVHQVDSSRRLVHGEFAGAGTSTEKDFRHAEWRPSERELNGA